MSGVDDTAEQTERLTLADINQGDPAAITMRLGHLFEHSPWIVERGLENRPFPDIHTFHAVLSGIMRSATADQQLTLLRAHPDLVGRAALAGTMTQASTAEQAAAGLSADDLSDIEREAFRRNNYIYTQRFGFPFIICARANKKASILEGFAVRMQNGRDVEIATALGEIEKIAWYRLLDATIEDGGAVR